MTTTEISNILGNSRTKACEDTAIDYLLTDSRNVIYPTKSLFFALVTKGGNGHKYVSELLEQGVKNVVVSQFNPEWEQADANIWVVENTLQALQQIAAWHRQQFDIPVVGITGSNGKTIVKEWLYTLLQPHCHCVRSPKSYNSQIGVPLSVWQLNQTHQVGIFEAGISTTHEMQNLQNIIRPTVGIFTNLGTAHQEGFASTEQKLAEKLQLFTSCKTLIYCSKYPIENVAATLLPHTQLLSWNFDDASAHINVHIEAQTTTQTKLWVQPKQLVPNHPSEAFCYTLPFTDPASLENAIHAIVCCLQWGYTHLDTQLLEPVNMRLSIKQGAGNCLLLDDAYTADLNGLQVALNVMDAQAKNKFSQRTVILSDMLQTGIPAQELYLTVSSLLQEKKVTQLIGIGPDLSAHAHLFPMPAHFYANTAQFLAQEPTFSNQIILIKGARCHQFEQITAHLEQKRHETVMEINLNALVDNFKHLRSFIKPETKTVAMIKANAYGCGALAIAQTLGHHHCDYFGVAVADEGAELRKAGIKTPIMVMNPENGSFDVLVQHHLEPEIYSFDILHRFIQFINKEGFTNYPIHI
jgi:alanine racemase